MSEFKPIKYHARGDFKGVRAAILLCGPVAILAIAYGAYLGGTKGLEHISAGVFLIVLLSLCRIVYAYAFVHTTLYSDSVLISRPIRPFKKDREIRYEDIDEVWDALIPGDLLLILKTGEKVRIPVSVSLENLPALKAAKAEGRIILHTEFLKAQLEELIRRSRTA